MTRQGSLSQGTSGAVQKEYIYPGGQVIGFVNGSTLYYVHNDHLGRAEVITNSAKGIVWRANNLAFDRTVTTAKVTYNLGFPGQYYDAEKESWYNYFRDYDAKLGRYLQSDPIGLLAGYNTFTYVSNLPTRFIDFLGLCECKGQARILQGNSAHIGKAGGMSPWKKNIQSLI